VAEPLAPQAAFLNRATGPASVQLRYPGVPAAMCPQTTLAVPAGERRPATLCFDPAQAWIGASPKVTVAAGSCWKVVAAGQQRRLEPCGPND